MTEAIIQQACDNFNGVPELAPICRRQFNTEFGPAWPGALHAKAGTTNQLAITPDDNELIVLSRVFCSPGYK